MRLSWSLALLVLLPGTVSLHTTLGLTPTRLRLSPQHCARSSPATCRVVRYEREEGDDAPIDVARVEELLFQRSQLRQDRNFQEADAIQGQLASMGVTVFDREMKWFVRGSLSNTRPLKYRREIGDANPCDVAAIESLILERSQLRGARDWEGADFVRSRLKREHGVHVIDKELKWYVGSGGRSLGADGRGSDRGYGRDGRADGADARGPPQGRGYGRVGRSGHGAARRDQAESALRMPEYDRTAAAEERRAYGKRERQLRAKSQKAEPYTRSAADTGPDGPSGEEVARIQRMVDERLSAKLKRNFEAADELLERLEEIGVQVSDDAREWRADGKSFLNLYYEEGGGETPAWLAEAIAQRGEAKRAKDFEEADRLLWQLEAEGIGLDDKRRTWRYLPAPPGGYKEPPPDEW